LKQNGVGASFHYVPLHSSPVGKKINIDQSDLTLTQDLSERLIRLPIFAGMKQEEYDYVIKTLTAIL
jgi:dTDP-4-amino-4,6-dideoxygalactose transaminase